VRCGCGAVCCRCGVLRKTGLSRRGAVAVGDGRRRQSGAVSRLRRRVRAGAVAVSTTQSSGDFDNLSDLELGERVDRPNAPFSTDPDNPLKATVEEDDTRRLETVGDATDAFEDYLAAKEGQVLAFEDQNTGDYLVLPHEHRWSSTYRRRTYARLKAAERYVIDKWDGGVPTTLLTLTAPHNDENGDPRPFESVLSDLKDGWDKARRVIRRETEGVETEYLAVFEPHGSGYPHLHVVLFGVARPSIGRKVQQYWVDRYVEGASADAQDCEVSRGRGVDLSEPAAYVMKYLSKSLARDGEAEQTALEAMPTVHGYVEFSALMWATGNRTYSMSQGLTAAIKESEPEEDSDDEFVDRDWVLVGTVHGVETGMYTGEEAEKLGKFLAGSRNQQRPPRATSDRPVYGPLPTS